MAQKTAKQKRITGLNRPLVWVLAAIVLLLALAGGGWFLDAYRFRIESAVARTDSVQVRSGTDFETLTRQLEERGMLCNPGRWRTLARRHGLDTVQAGNYLLEKGASYRTVLNRLAHGRQTPVRVIFNSLRTVERLAGVLGRQLEADSADWLATFRDPSVAASTGLTRATFPSLFIPNTYELYWTIDPAAFIERMKMENGHFWTDARCTQAAALELTPEEVSTLASIVIEETKRESEMTRVAGVYINRLRKGMPLQADPTVKYAVGDPTLRRILHRHLEVDSPYNTYKHGGLPPGPICIPPIAAIDAVLAYADPANRNDDYYFCAAADFSGRHVFAKTLDQHNRNKAAYVRELNRRGIR